MFSRTLFMVLAAMLACMASVSGFVFPISPKWPVQTLHNCPSPVAFLAPHYYQDFGAERVRIQYGPFNVPGKNDEGGMKVFNIEEATKPCSDCVITTFYGDIMYADGGYANMNTSMMLHHLIVFNTNVTDKVCPDRGAERFFATGNERQPIDIGHQGQSHAGYWLSDEPMSFLGMAMNYNEEARDVYFTIEFEYIPKNWTSFAHLQPYTLDGAGICGLQDVAPPVSGGTFEFSMQPAFQMDKDLIIVGGGGHIHDGAKDLQILRNGEVACTLLPSYGTIPGSFETDGAPHLSSISQCTDLGPTKQGDAWSITSHYDFGEFPPMMNSTDFAPVMGVSIIYALDPSATGPP